MATPRNESRARRSGGRHRVIVVLAACAIAADAVAAPGDPAAGLRDPSATPAPAVSEQVAPTAAGDPAPPPITTEVWREPPVPLDLAWQLLSWPERAIELGFTPVAALVTLVERYRIDRRTYDLLRNDAGTVVVTPQIEISFSDGFGGGASLALKDLLGREERFGLGALARLDRDYEIEAGYLQPLATLDGRELVVDLEHGVDRNLRYFGLGNRTVDADERVVRRDYLTAASQLELTGRGVLDLTGRVRVAYRHEQLSPGEDPSIAGVGSPGDNVTPPPGFDAGRDFAGVGVGVAYDSRDTTGRPTRGALVTLEVDAEKQLSGDGSALSGHASAWWHLPILPDRRVVLVGAGVDMVTSLASGDVVPLHALVTLGRKNHLRGFEKGRFRDRHGWWASAEYRFPVFEYLTTGVALEPSLFFDLGRVGHRLGDLVDGGLHRSYGVGLRAAHETRLIFRLELGRSAEGFQLGFSAGSDL